jgi:membrane peptidoglycan carboxypeptidase
VLHGGSRIVNVVQKRKLLAARRVRKNGSAGRILLIVGLSMVSLAGIGAAVAAGVFYNIYQSYAQDYVPIEQKLRQTHIGLTDIYDRNGVFLGSLSNPDAQLLEPVPLSQISEWVIEATISTEDNSFWTNPGINIRGLARAAWENYVVGEFGAGTGGSSITQQLIKNVYICPNIGTDDDDPCVTAERTLDRKLREIVYALELERDYSKEQILEWYLNQVSYADRYIGIEAAAQGYFRKPAADLTLAEAALLAGVVAYPSRYHPRLNCVRGEAQAGRNGEQECLYDELGRMTVGGEAKRRQEEVLDLMVVHKRATQAQVDAAKAEPLLVYPPTSRIRAVAWIDNQVQPRLLRMCEAGILPLREGTKDCWTSVHSAGYRVTTTIDIVETELAQQMMRGFIQSGLDLGCNCHNAAIVTIEPATGQVIVYAPNRDPSYVSDRRVAGDVDQAVEIRQPGSSFKPFVYLAWMDMLNRHPMSIFWDTNPIPIEGVQIVNPANNSTGIVTARAALGGSQNIPAFRAVVEVGVDNVIAMAKRVGFTTLEQNFDPTFVSHEDVGYGPSIATGGSNIRVFDMAYANSVLANMGVMVGVPHLAKYVQLKDLGSTAWDTGAAYDRARQQSLDFQRGHIRIPGTRELDPVTVLRVTDRDGNILYDHEKAGDLVRKQVVDAGSVWLLHSIMSDCTARFIIWGCGTSNTDRRLDVFLDGTRVPGGVKTGTQQGPRSISDTVATWVNGYSRDAATSVWVGNANNELVRDGPSADYAAANTTLWLYKHWMQEYHRYLDRSGRFQGIRGFDDLRPGNVAQRSMVSPHTERDGKGECTQTASTWVRTDVRYEDPCEKKDIDIRNGLLAGPATPPQFRASREFVKLPAFRPDLAKKLAEERNIPIAPTEVSTGQTAVSVVSPTAGAIVAAPVPVVVSVNFQGLKKWTVEIGQGANPADWRVLATGEGPVTDAAVGTINPAELEPGVYTIRVTTTGGAGGLTASATFNVRAGPLTPTPGPGSPTPTSGPGGTVTPTPGGVRPGDPTPQLPR